jgi:hypothetical protein
LILERKLYVSLKFSLIQNNELKWRFFPIKNHDNWGVALLNKIQFLKLNLIPYTQPSNSVGIIIGITSFKEIMFNAVLWAKMSASLNWNVDIWELIVWNLHKICGVELISIDSNFYLFRFRIAVRYFYEINHTAALWSK